MIASLAIRVAGIETVKASALRGGFFFCATHTGNVCP